MLYLVDTNILLRFVDRNQALHLLVRATVRQLRQDGHILQVTSQNCVEYWNVATRPVNKNGFGFTPAQADKLLRIIERLFPVLPESPTLYTQWRQLVVQYQVSGVQVHDARLVAAMKTNGITHILTFNTTDFIRYTSESIIAVAPK